MRLTISNNNLVRFQMQTTGDEPSIGIVSFNDPAHMNAMTVAMAQDFRSIVTQAGELKPAAIIVTGKGAAFSAGEDMDMIRQKQQQTAEVNSHEMLEFYDAYLGILDLGIPLVAAINGAAIGAGLCFACACDCRIAADIDKNILGFSFSKLGLTPGMGGTIFPRQLVGSEKASDMLENGYNITPHQALEIGMVNKIVPAERLMSRARDLATDIASSPHKRHAILSRRISSAARAEALAEEARLQGASFLSNRHLTLFPKFIKALEERKRRKRAARRS